MLPSFCNESITVERATMRDSRGSQVQDWTHPTTWTLNGCNVQPVSSSVAWTEQGQAVTVRRVLRCPPDAEIAEGDRVTIDGKQYRIDGVPHPWKSPTGAVSHIEAYLIDWEL